MRTPYDRIGYFLDELMLRRKRLPSRMAAELGVSHTTIGRWLQGKDIPSTTSCQLLAEYSGVPLETILRIAGHLPPKEEEEIVSWPDNTTADKS